MNKKIFSRLTYQNKITLSALIFLVAVLGLIYFLIAPTVKNVKTIKTKTENQRLEAEKNYAQGQDLKKLKDNIKAVEPRLGEIEQVFIKKDDTLSFITSLEAAAAKNNVTEKAKLGEETALGQSYSQLPLQLEVRGSFAGLIGFISDLEKLKNYIDLNSLQITALNSGSPPPAGTSTTTKTLVTQIYANTYWEN